MYPLAEYIFVTNDKFTEKDSYWDFILIVLFILFFLPVMMVTDKATGGIGIIAYCIIFGSLFWKFSPSKITHLSRKNSFEAEYDEILNTYKKNRKKTGIQIFDTLNPSYFNSDDIDSLCLQFEDLEIHKKLKDSKKKTALMRELKTSLSGLKKNEKVFFRSQSIWSKGDPAINHNVYDYGHVYFTNFAIIFSGYKRSTRINFTRVVKIDNHESLISVHKTAGINDNFALSDESLNYCMLFYNNKKKVK